MSSNGRRERGLASLGSIIGAATFGVAAVTLGYMIAQGHISYVKDRLVALEQEVSLLKSENSTLKLELLSAKEVPASSGTTQRDPDLPAGVPNEPEPLRDEGENLNVHKPEQVTVDEGETANLFNGQLYISVTQTSFGGFPPRYRVYGFLGRPGKPNQELNGVDPGYITNFQGIEVRVLSARTFSAQFLVTKLVPSTTVINSSIKSKAPSGPR
jgi:hypothetical protein